MSTEISKTYNPQEVEDKIYQKWEKSGLFNPDNLPWVKKKAKPFVISMPPPNVTGDLHMGHAIALTLEDILVRYHRLKHELALWVPGTDHAGIATQIMVERMLLKEGVNRRELGRENFLKSVWAWKEKFGTKITKQIKQLGASCDWTREHFTMDKNLTAAVQEAFIKLFNDGLIYRGQRIISWCPRCFTAISDLEVAHQKKQGQLYYIKYPVIGTADKFITVATTRPETMLGDTAVAVNLKDKRYKHLIGRKVLVPLINREIPIISDHRVDMEFGTGAVKVTPAHDPVDWEIGQKHHLPAIKVIDERAKMTYEAGGDFSGLKVKEAREKIVEKLKLHYFLQRIEDYTYQIALCERCGSIIEPLVSEQWFLSMKKLAEPAIKVVREGKIKIIPKHFAKIYFHWLHNIRDWCISRQLWWGHQIPVWYCSSCDKPIASREKPDKCPCGNDLLKQDEDTLDTWFSSALWTFSTLGWPEKTKDLKRFHPTDVMETGWDILFFWVARMIMMSLYLVKEVPFKTIYLHGLILNKDGKKMSKSKGTGVDPIIMTSKYGTDAIRLSLVLGTAAGRDFRLHEEKIASYRNFCNKLWNISRFILSQKTPKSSKPKAKSLADQWILSKLNKLTEEITNHLDKFEFGQAGEKIYEFVWHQFADWYLEISKVEQNIPVLYHVLENILILLHPFAPYITEEIWAKLPKTKNLLIISEWPKPNKKTIDKKAGNEFKKLQNLVIKYRDSRRKRKIPPQEIFSVKIKKTNKLVWQNKEVIEKLAKIKLD
jgi:valyl-tRNA synthetase